MDKEELRFENDELYHYYPLPQYGEGISKRDLVMTKEVFMGISISMCLIFNFSVFVLCSYIQLQCVL